MSHEKLTRVRTNSCSPILAILDDVLLHCQNSATLEAAHCLLQTLTANPSFATAMMESVVVTNGPGPVLLEELEDMGFGGLWRFCSLNPTQEPDKQCFAWTEKLIDVSCLYFLVPWHPALFFRGHACGVSFEASRILGASRITTGYVLGTQTCAR